MSGEFHHGDHLPTPRSKRAVLEGLNVRFRSLALDDPRRGKLSRMIVMLEDEIDLELSEPAP